MENSTMYANNGFSECLWSNSLKISTIVVSIIVLVCLLSLIRTIWNGNGTAVHYVYFILLFVASIMAAFVSPQKVAVDADGIRVCMVEKTLKIPVNEIEKVEDFSNRGGLIRTCGIGGFLGYTLFYKSTSIGSFIAYVTDWSQSYVIFRKDKKPIVVSVQDPSIFKPFMKD